MTFNVTKVMTTETAHRLCNYMGKCAHIHGHSYRWEVTVCRKDGVLDATGFVVDFSKLKAAMKQVIYDRFDHALVLWKEDPLADIAAQVFGMATDGENQKIIWFEENPTAENFARFVAKGITDYFGDNHLYVLRVRVWETADSYAESLGPN